MAANYFKNALIALLIVSVVINSAHANTRICGFKLTAALQSICRNQVCGVANSDMSQKHSIDEVGIDQEQPMGWARTWYPVNAYGQYDEKPGKRVGIAESCCQKKCSLAYLRTFCCTDEV